MWILMYFRFSTEAFRDASFLPRDVLSAGILCRLCINIQSAKAICFD